MLLRYFGHSVYPTDYTQQAAHKLVCSAMRLGIRLVLGDVNMESTNTLASQLCSRRQSWPSCCYPLAASCDSWSSSAEWCRLYTYCWATAVNTANTSTLSDGERFPLCCCADVVETFHYAWTSSSACAKSLVQFLHLSQDFFEVILRTATIICCIRSSKFLSFAVIWHCSMTEALVGVELFPQNL